MKKQVRHRIQTRKFPIWKSIIAHKVFKDFFYSKDLKSTCESIKKYRGEIKALRDFLRADDYFGGDFRTGEETYGYKSIEEIEGNLDYISDRFSAEFRLTWLLELPEKVETLL